MATTRQATSADLPFMVHILRLVAGGSAGPLPLDECRALLAEEQPAPTTEVTPSTDVAPTTEATATTEAPPTTEAP